MKPYVVVSDVHCHAWSAFSQVDPDGVNSRLRIILDELIRAAKVLRENGGDKMVIAGDLFHVRGSVKPSVMNPTDKTFRGIVARGITVEAIAGNHDLEGRDADVLGNAMETLGNIAGFHPITSVYEDDDCVYFPWFAELDDLRAALAKHANPDKDAIIHAPVNGVLKGLPDLGLTPEELASFGYRRVIAGHYHNYVEFPGGVFSAGATTHQTWSDPGTRAGFMLVWPDRVEHHPSHAPEFVDLTDPSHITPHLIDGNYVRMKLTDVTDEEISAFRKELEDMGARGVTINATRKVAATRTASISAGASLEVSVAEYIDKQVESEHKEAIQKAAEAVLREARSR